ncbi:MAG TPA: septum formation initiator [Acetobacteraceae bacterium]|jgi:carboxypeptidase C (cathepsin A)
MFYVARWLVLLLLLAGTAAAQPATHARPTPQPAPHTATEPAAFPAEVTTHHTLQLAGRTLHFTATAGTIRLTNDEGEPRAELAVIAYQEEGAAPATRPVTFFFNGGPGMASGWLQVGAVGPWRIALNDDAGIPSASAVPLPNADTWLDFTDLVFIDPPGTGYSRIVSTDKDTRRQYFSVAGDINALAEAVRRWLDHNDRNVSPKYIVGESYGGFRAPRLVRVLQSEQGVGVSGVVMISPLLDAHRESVGYDPFAWVDRLPSQVAAARALKGPVTRASVADAERYAATDYITDLLQGEHDPAAIARVSARVATLTGLDPALVQRFHGRLDADVFLHELERAQGKVGSVYDPTITRGDPFPHQAYSYFPDPVLEGFKAPIASAMMAIYSGKLHWRPDAVYELANDAAFNQWDWGHGMGRPESVTAMQAALSLDPHLHILIAHGLFDLRTPYFATALILRALPEVAPPGRVRLVVYPGGHMFYSQDASSHALHEDARALYAQ